MKKKVLITIFIVIVILIAVIGYFVYIDMQQEDKLKAELTEINELVNTEPFDMEEVNNRLNRTVTTGDYAIVEKAFKNYLSDSFANSTQIAEILSDEKITTLLTSENYQLDGKDFIQSKEYINSTRETLEQCKAKYTEFFTKEKAMSYINDKGLDEYYIDLYEQEYVGDIEKEASGDNTVQDSIDQIISILNTSEEVLNLLSENPNDWEIQGDNIVFSNENLTNQYEELINKL